MTTDAKGPGVREELRRLLAEATPGPWEVGEPDRNEQATIYAGPDDWIALLPHQCLESIRIAQERNAALIAAMRNALPGILDALDAAEAERDAIRAKLEDRNAKALAALFGALDEPMECGHPIACLPEHTAQEAREHIERIVCGWCVANVERDEARRELSKTQAKLADLEAHRG
jgi:hypothetical protein